MKSFFVHNDDVKIHVLESGVPSGNTPSLLVIGGLYEIARFINKRSAGVVK